MTTTKIEELNKQRQLKKDQLTTLTSDSENIKLREPAIPGELKEISENNPSVITQINEILDQHNIEADRTQLTNTTTAAQFMAEQIQTLEALKTKFATDTQTLDTLLRDIDQLLEQQTEIPADEINTLIQNSGLKIDNKWSIGMLGFTFAEGNTDGLEWLLSTLPSEKYTDTGLFSYFSAETQKQNLTQAIKTKLKTLDATNKIEESNTAFDTAKASMTELQQQLTTNYQKKSELEAEQLAIPGKRENIASKIGVLNIELTEITQEETPLLQIKAREEFVTELKEILNTYTTTRAERFSVKDKLNAADKTAREETITGLKNNLDVFAESGNTEEMVEQLNAAIDRFPGVHLQTALHQITLKLIGDTPEVEITQTDEILERHKIENAAYVKKIENLYIQIGKMTLFGHELSNPDEKDIVIVLAQQLEKDVDYFVSQHPDNVPDQEAFKSFQTKFNARLHSQDVVMSQHENWKSLVLNVVLAVITLGIALGIKAIHSKVTEGRVSFFAAKTEKQSKIKDIAESLDDVEQQTKPGNKIKGIEENMEDVEHQTKPDKSIEEYMEEVAQQTKPGNM